MFKVEKKVKAVLSRQRLHNGNVVDEAATTCGVIVPDTAPAGLSYLHISSSGKSCEQRADFACSGAGKLVVKHYRCLANTI